MNAHDLKSSILAGLKSGQSLLELRGSLQRFAAAAGTSVEATRVLAEIRVEIAGDGPTEDRVLEVLDIVAGFCGPSLRVW